jgi:hypothetical protein
MRRPGLTFGSIAAILLTFSAPAARAVEASAKEKPAVNVAFVLLAQSKLPKGEEVEKAFSEFAVKGERVRFKTKKGGKHGEALELELGAGGTAIVMLMPAPVPNREADEAVRYSVSALSGRWKLPPHKAHLVVTATEAQPLVEALSSFTSLVAAVAKASSTVGIYFGNAGATHDPKFFQEIARERETRSRLVLWSGVSIAKEEGGRLSLLSLGMKQLTLPDILLSVPASKSKEAIGTLFELMGYLIDAGKALPEGDTIGRSATEKIPVHYVPSPVDPKAMVWRVALD